MRRREHSSQGDLQARVPVKVWRGRQSEAISSCCIVGTSCLARVSNHADFWTTKLPNQPGQGRQCSPGHSLRCTGCTQHALICFRTPQHRHIFSTVHARVEACSRPSLLWSASSGWWAHLQGLREQWDGSGSWICAGTLSLASSHWHTFVLGKCPTGMFQGDAALYVRTASAIYPAAWLVCLSNQPQARSAPAGLSATLISIAAGWRDA